MILVALIALASFSLVVAFRERPIVWLSAGIATLVFVPSVATRAWLSGAGIFSEVHPAIWVFASGAIVSALDARLRKGQSDAIWPLILAMFTWLGVCGLLITLMWGSPASFVLFFAVPMTAFLAVVASRGQATVDHLVRAVLVIAAAQSVLAIAQWSLADAIFYEGYYATNYWWRPRLTRSLGTLDSPLDLASFLTMSLPLITRIRRAPVAVATAILISVGVFVTGSRVGIVVAAAVLAWVLVTRTRNFLVGILMSVSIAVGTIAFLASPFASAILDRFGERGDVSTGVRAAALDVGLAFVAAEPWAGRGPGASYGFSSSQLQSSFENGYLSAAIDYGLPFAITLLVLQCWAVLRSSRIPLAIRLPGVLAIMWGFAYSSFLSGSAFGSLVWIFIGVGVIAASPGARIRESGARTGRRMSRA